jgi:hypothetical protein
MRADEFFVIAKGPSDHSRAEVTGMRARHHLWIVGCLAVVGCSNKTNVATLDRGACAAMEQQCPCADNSYVCRSLGDICPAPTTCGTTPMADSGVTPNPQVDSGPSCTGACDASTHPPPDAGIDCAGRLAEMLASPIAPNTRYAGFDLTTGANPKGLTIDEANADGCGHAVVETTPSFPGYRMMTWGNQDISATYNLDSHVIYQFVLGSTYTGKLTFSSRAGGAFGSHQYELGIGHVLRDGIEFPVDFTATSGHASASVNEIYDGIIATFMPATAAVAECKSAGTCLDVKSGSLNYFGARPVHFYAEIDANTNRPVAFYNFWPGGMTDCTTLNANLERMLNAYIGPADEQGIGGLQLSKVGTNPLGLTRQEADAIECNGVQATSPDVGYGAIQWGPHGEVELEYNMSAHPDVAYKLSAKQGYLGTLTASSADGLHGYVIAVGSMKKDGAPMSIDWANGTATNAAATEIFNALWWSWFFNTTATSTSADCVASADCVITPDDGNNHAVFIFNDGPVTVGLTFPRGTSAPSSIFSTWANGR